MQVLSLFLVFAQEPPASQTKTPPLPTPPGQVAPSQKSEPAPPKIVIQNAFLAQHDVNRDGRLDPTELKRRFVKLFAKVDVNRDGFLDAQEILFDRHGLGRTARRMENLDLDREGRLVARGSAPGEGVPAAAIAQRVLQSIDRNGDGRIVGEEIGDTIHMEVVPRARNALDALLTPPDTVNIPVETPMESGAIGNEAPRTPNGKVPPPIPIPPKPTREQQTSTPPTTGAGDGEAKSKPKDMHKEKDGLPTAEQMLAHLDKNGDQLLDETEAVDQLAKNFRMIDKNRDGKLSQDEIERALRLARMFGIKPMKSPKDYAKQPQK